MSNPGKLGTFAGRVTWTSYWRFMRKYHHFEIADRGIDHILHCGGPAMIVGYHGKPGARDLIMLQTLLLDEYGQRTHAITSDLVFRLPLLGGLAEGMQLVSRSQETIDEVIEKGEKLVVTPGGIAEAWAPRADRNTVKWNRLGYLRLAARRGLPIILVAGVGVDDAFIPLYDAYHFWKPLWNSLRPYFDVPEGTGLWLGLGPLGLWPFTPPFPVRIVQHIAAPIRVPSRLGKPGNEGELRALHRELVARVQKMLDDGLKDRRARSTKEELTWVDQTL